MLACDCRIGEEAAEIVASALLAARSDALNAAEADLSARLAAVTERAEKAERTVADIGEHFGIIGATPEVLMAEALRDGERMAELRAERDAEKQRAEAMAGALRRMEAAASDPEIQAHYARELGVVAPSAEAKCGCGNPACRGVTDNENHQCGGPREACAVPGCRECGFSATPPPSGPTPEGDPDWGSVLANRTTWRELAAERRRERDAANAELAKVREELEQAFNINAEWERKSREDLDTAAAQFATLRAERDAEKARADAAEKRAEEAVAKAREWEALAKRFSANYDAARARAEAIQRDHGADLSRLDKWRLRAGVAERRIAEAAGFLRLIIQPSDNVQAAINALTPPSVSGGAEGEGGEVSEDAWLHTLDPCPSCKHWRSSHERQTGRCRRRGCRCVKFNAPPATDWKALATRLAEALRETTGGLASLARVERHPAQTPTEAAAVAELARLVVVGVDALAAFDSARGAGEGKNEP
jgi:hypothetical protein